MVFFYSTLHTLPKPPLPITYKNLKCVLLTYSSILIARTYVFSDISPVDFLLISLDFESFILLFEIESFGVILLLVELSWFGEFGADSTNPELAI